MGIFTTTLERMIYLFAFIFIGYLLVKLKVLKRDAACILSKLENTLFIPALILGTFLKNFSPSTLGTMGKLMLFSLLLELIIIPIAIAVAKLSSKDKFSQNVVTYGLSFSNFSFMGNAIVMVLFPDFFLEYLIFTLVLWAFIYVWATPTLLIPLDENASLRTRLKSFCNPMFICLLIGIVLGLLQVKLPTPVLDVIDTAGSCMSPVAMLLTGITIASADVKGSLHKAATWIACAARLLIIPGIALLIFYFLPLPKTYLICAFCTLAMPLGLSPIVIPAAYGKDTSLAAAMALISHALSILTLPLMIMLMQRVLGV